MVSFSSFTLLWLDSSIKVSSQAATGLPGEFEGRSQELRTTLDK